MTTVKTRVLISAFLTTLLAAGALRAETTMYVVELMVLRNLEAAQTSPEASASTTEADAERAPLGRFMRLEWDELRLDDVWDSLARSRNFKPVFRAGWVQAGLSGDDVQAVRISGSLNGGGRITGTAELALSRYLHLKLDLTVTGPDGSTFQLIERRRMRSGNLNYFDNPYFGVIARVTRE